MLAPLPRSLTLSLPWRNSVKPGEAGVTERVPMRLSLATSKKKPRRSPVTPPMTLIEKVREPLLFSVTVTATAGVGPLPVERSFTRNVIERICIPLAPLRGICEMIRRQPTLRNPLFRRCAGVSFSCPWGRRLRYVSERTSAVALLRSPCESIASLLKKCVTLLRAAWRVSFRPAGPAKTKENQINDE